MFAAGPATASMVLWMIAVSVGASAQCCVLVQEGIASSGWGLSACPTPLRRQMPSTFGFAHSEAQTAEGRMLWKRRRDHVFTGMQALRIEVPAALNLRGGMLLKGKRKRLQSSPVAEVKSKRRRAAETLSANESAGQSLSNQMGSSEHKDTEVLGSNRQKGFNDDGPEGVSSCEDDVGSKGDEPRRESGTGTSDTRGARTQPAWLPPLISPSKGANGHLQPKKHFSLKAGGPRQSDPASVDHSAIQIDLGNLCGFDPGADLGPISNGTSAGAVHARARLVLSSMFKELQSQETLAKTLDGALEVFFDFFWLYCLDHCSCTGSPFIPSTIVRCLGGACSCLRLFFGASIALYVYVSTLCWCWWHTMRVATLPSSLGFRV
jgi:hypothetical protein